MFSLYFYKNKLQINDTIDSSEDLLDQSYLKQECHGILLITNNYMKDNIGAKTLRIIFKTQQLYHKHINK